MDSELESILSSLEVGPTNGEIPKQIHQTWKTDVIPDNLKDVVASWTKNNPMYGYKCWDDLQCYNFVKEHYKWFLPYYENYEYSVQRADAFRYFVMYHYGGIYADLDMLSLTSMDPIINKAGGVILGIEGMGKNNVEQVGNAIIFSSPKHPFWIHVFKGLIESFHQIQGKGTIFETTGPRFLHNIYTMYPTGVTICPSRLFYPLSYRTPPEKFEKFTRSQYPNSFTVHLWAGMWRNEPTPITIQFPDFPKMSFLIEPRADKRSVVENKLRKSIIHRDYLLEKWFQLLQPGQRAAIISAYNGYLAIPLAFYLKSNLEYNPEPHDDDTEPPKTLVYAFEPYEPFLQKLATNIHINHLTDYINASQIMPCHRATNLFLNKMTTQLDKNDVHLVWRTGMNGAIACNACPLDACLCMPLSLIHIDSHGNELNIIYGAEQVIKRDRPFITMTLLSDQERKSMGCTTERQQVLDYMSDNLQYNYQPIKGAVFLFAPIESDVQGIFQELIE